MDFDRARLLAKVARLYYEQDDRVIGLSLDEMRKIPRVVAVAGAPSKLKAIRAALQAKLIDVIVTDHVTATELLNKV